MARLVFSNVPTKSGGVISGNISIGAGSPFGVGGKYEAQVSHIQAEIAKAPEGFYDPVGWEEFLRTPDEFINLTELSELERLQRELERRWNPVTGESSYEKHLIWEKERRAEIEILKDKIKQDLLLKFEEHQRQLETDFVEKLALEQKISETATLREEERRGEVPTAIDIIIQQIRDLKEGGHHIPSYEIPLQYGVGVESSKILQLQKQIQEKKKYGVSFGTGHPHLKIIAKDIQKLQAEIIAEEEAIKKKALELEMVRPPRVSVFDEPPPETVTVAPPGYVKPEKPPRIDVHDPSTESAFDPFGGLLEGVFGEPTEVTGVSTDPFRYIPEPEVEPELEVTTADVEPPIEPEQMEFLCSDVYRLENGNVIKTTYDTLSVPQIQNFINQGLLIRDCGTPSPSVEEVRSHYGYTADVVPPPEEPEEEPETVDVPPPEFPPEPEPTVTVTPGLPTTANFGIAGILFAGVLALPILAGLGKWK